MPFYAVHKGKRRGIYTDWLECKQNIFGVRHPIFKKFNTKEEAEHFLIHGFGTKTNQSMMDTLGIGGANRENIKTKDVTDARDNAKIDVNENDKSEPAYSDKNVENISTQPPKHIINVFTDGSLIRKKRKNGETKLLCGYGIYIPSYGLMEELRYAGTIHDNKTNNRGELKAIIDGLNYILDFVEETLVVGASVSIATHSGVYEENEKLKNTQIMLYTDSSYSKLILGDTGVKYRKAGYLVSKKSDEKVKNADMVEEIMEIRDKIATYGMELIVKHVYAHTNLDTFEANGNRLADEYANIGANKTFTNN
jgi:ribonuclease HI